MKKIIQKTLAVMLCTVMVVGIIPSDIISVHAEADTSLASMRTRAEAIVNYTWVPSQRISTWNGSSYNGKAYFEKGESVVGVPYTLFTTEIGGISYSLCSLTEYKSVASSNYSATAYCVSVSNTRTGPVYGSCCADFVCEVFGGKFMSGSTMRYHSVAAIKRSNYGTTSYGVKAASIQAGDAISNTDGTHIIWIGDVTDSYFVVYEQAPPAARKRIVYKSSCVNSNGYLVYGGSTYNIVTRSNEFIPTENYSGTTARIDINPNGGTAQDSFYVNYGEKCNLTIDSAWYPGYALAGWNLYRPADGKWFVDGQGWCTASEIEENGYKKQQYASNLSMTLDSSWYSNCSTSVSVFTFFAVWKEATYKININANGGTAQDSFYVNYEEKCNLTIDSAWYPGYALAGWNLYRPADGKWFVGGEGWCTASEISANGYTKKQYVPNLSMTLDSSWFGNCNESISMFTFFAVWTEATYTVNINANGGTANTSSLSVKYNTTCNLSPNFVERSGYELAGWNLYRPADGKWFVGGKGWYSSSEIIENGYTKKQYIPNLSMTLDNSWFGNCDESVSMFTFYAVWTGEKYTVEFDGNGATSGSMSDQSFTYDVAQNLTANAFNRAYTVIYNYNGATGGNSKATDIATATFNGWATSESGSKVYDDQQNVKNLAESGTIHLYANWTLGSITLPTPTKTGYTFDGWYSGSNDDTKILADVLYPTADQTLYAHWIPNTNTAYSVEHYVMDTDGKYPTTATKIEYKTGTTEATLTLANLKDSTLEVVNGIAYSSAQVDDTAVTTAVIASDGSTIIKLYYVRSQYTLTLERGAGIASVVGAGTYYFGQSVNIDATPATGYTWQNWSDGNTTKARTYVMPAQATTLTATATAIQYTVKFMLNDGSNKVYLTISDQTYGTVVDFPSENPTREGYNFLGWSTNAQGTEWIEMSVTVVADTVLYAIWEEIAQSAPEITVAESSTAVIDRTNGFIYGLKEMISEEELKNSYLNVSGSGHLTVEYNGYIGTGSVVKLIDNTTGEVAETFTVVIFGDLNGDGIISNQDIVMAKMINASAVTVDLSNTVAFAADLFADNMINNTDVVILKGMQAGTIIVDQATRTTKKA